MRRLLTPGRRKAKNWQLARNSEQEGRTLIYVKQETKVYIERSVWNTDYQSLCDLTNVNNVPFAIDHYIAIVAVFNL